MARALLDMHALIPAGNPRQVRKASSGTLLIMF